MKKAFLSEAILARAFIFVMLPRLVDLYQVFFFKLCAWGQKWPYPRGHMFYIGLYRGKNVNSSCLKPQGLEPQGKKTSISNTKHA